MLDVYHDAGILTGWKSKLEGAVAGANGVLKTLSQAIDAADQWMLDALSKTPLDEVNGQAKEKSDDKKEGSGSELNDDWAGATSDQDDSKTSLIARIAQVMGMDEIDVASGASTARTCMTRRFG